MITLKTIAYTNSNNNDNDDEDEEDDNDDTDSYIKKKNHIHLTNETSKNFKK